MTSRYLNYSGRLTCALLGVFAVLAFIEAALPVPESGRGDRLWSLAAGLGFAAACAAVAGTLRWRPRWTGAALLLIALSYGPLFVAGLAVAQRADTRTVSEVVRDMRRKDPDVYPGTTPSAFVRTDLSGWPDHLEIESQDIHPFGGIAGATVAGCNETGEWLTWRTDRYGFRNPDSVWDTPGKLDAIVIGDSFAEGSCVRDDEHVAGRLRARYPATITLGRGGSGPLLELALLREFTAERTARHLYWMFFEEWDLQDIDAEFNHNVLEKYLAPDYRQGLAAQAREVDTAYRAFIDGRLAAQETSAGGEPPAIRRAMASFTSVVVAANVPHAARRSRASTSAQLVQALYTPLDLERLRTIMGLMAAEAGSLESSLTFVYLPRYPLDHLGQDWPAPGKQMVLQMAREHDMQVVDVTDVFRANGRLTEFFALPGPSHYNSRGYGLIAEELIALTEARPDSP